MNKPEHISYKDWELLNNKYSSKQLEEYFNRIKKRKFEREVYTCKRS